MDDFIGGRTAGRVHQVISGIVTILDSQEVTAIFVYIQSFKPNIKCSELQRHDQSLLHLYHLLDIKVASIVVTEVWRGEDSCGSC